LIVVMVIITVFDLLITLLEGVEVYRFNKCTKVLMIFSDDLVFIIRTLELNCIHQIMIDKNTLLFLAKNTECI